MPISRPSATIDADRIDTADFEHKLIKKYRPKGEYVAWPVLVARLERRLKTMQPACPIDALRSDISTHLS